MNNLSQTAELTVETNAFSAELEKTPLRNTFAASSLRQSLSQITSWILEKARKQQARKTLKVCESVSLGDKRFVAVVQVENERFLIGGASSSVAMLARLESKTFADVLRSSREAGES